MHDIPEESEEGYELHDDEEESETEEDHEVIVRDGNGLEVRASFCKL